MNLSRPLIRVVAGIVSDRQGRYLLSSRPAGKSYTGYWEFAGGKIEAGETEFAALQREFAEELGIRIKAARVWLTRVHDYRHVQMHLRFFRIGPDEWEGEIQAREGQQWSWQQAGNLNVSPILPANHTLLAALTVPNQLTGCLVAGFFGKNPMGTYRVVPFEQAKPPYQNILMSESQLRTYGKKPEAQSVWVWIQYAGQWQHVQNADVVVWQVCGHEQAQAACSTLLAGVAMPLVIVSDKETASIYRCRWLEYGAHTVVVDGEIV